MHLQSVLLEWLAEPAPKATGKSLGRAARESEAVSAVAAGSMGRGGGDLKLRNPVPARSTCAWSPTASCAMKRSRKSSYPCRAFFTSTAISSLGLPNSEHLGCSTLHCLFLRMHS